MTWNYRLVRFTKPESWIEIRRAYYDEGTVPDSKPHSVGGYSAEVGGETLDEVSDTLEKMRRALTMPILDASDFGIDDGTMGDNRILPADKLASGSAG
jgi:hypothetical protein